MRKSSDFRSLLATIFTVFAIVAVVTQTGSGQSQALNGQIEGVVTDQNGAAVPSATVKVRNTQTGTERTVTTDSNGTYRAPLLPLGTYQVTIEGTGFKRLVRDGITITAGSIATINAQLEPGGLEETVTITSDAPIADPGKIDVGRVLNTREVQGLPLVSRNPYNFSLLQANVVGRPNTEFGVPRVSANGYARRTNFQLDGNVNTQANSGGLRLVPISETFVSEVQLVTNGFAAEFGNTPGLVMNNITPSGTNSLRGSAAYRFRRTSMSSRPFNTLPTAIKAPTKVDNLTFAAGGPIIKDRWHIYGGYEWVTRDFAGRPQQTVDITPENRQALIALGLPAGIFVDSIPASQKVNFLIFRTDAQLNDANRLTGRFIRFTNFSPNNVGGGFNTLERTVDLDDKSNSLAIQLASVITPNVFNEFRYQRAHRNSIFLPTQYTPSGVSVTITNVASFGPAANINAVSPIETMNQFQNNLTWTKGDHTMKFGFGVNHIYDYRRSNVNATYTFGSLAAYQAAIAPGATEIQRQSYTSYAETMGDPEFEYDTTFFSAFAQDDWKATRRLKLSYGLRYDLYSIPEGIADAPLAESREFKVDKNNFSPRLGAVYLLREGDLPTVIRGSFGFYYDTVYLSMYEGALQQNGVGRYANRTFTGRGNAGTGTPTAGAPSFPGTLGALPPGTVLPPESLTVVSPDFSNMYAMHFQTQIEQALSENYSITAGYIHSEGRQLAVYRQTNCMPTGATLADGRPKYSCAAGNRYNPTFQNIIEVGSGGNSRYDAMTLQLSKRFSQGYQFSFNYTLSRVRDNAPERNLQGVGAASQTDPSNRAWDWAYGVADQRHTVSSSFVARPKFEVESKALRYLLNNNEFGLSAFAGSGETFPINTNFDLNGDGIGNDIPVGLERNAGRAPGFVNVDLRYSRVFPITERFKLEFFGEATNIFNINSTLSYSGTTITNTGTPRFNTTTGEMLVSMDQLYQGFTRSAQESRQLQFGFKFTF
ncbi:MAG: TonB-dependent receptor [Acidobacteria bacterium]|nr:TonB-dependent receptor [Acidobacteriota bacterium]